MISLLDMTCGKYSYEEWDRYLEENDRHRLEMDFSGEHRLSREERRLIFPSVRAFQTGERSDGACLMKEISAFADRIGEPACKEVMRRFIKEENCHSAYLAGYMRFHEEPLAKSGLLDRIFRRLRQRGGIFYEITVLETAEIIALSYYSALGHAADRIGSPALSAVCAQMLHDELRHIVLQSYTLSFMEETRAGRLFRTGLMRLTTDALWAAFGGLLKAGGYTCRSFRAENLGYLHQSFALSAMMRESRKSLPEER